MPSLIRLLILGLCLQGGVIARPASNDDPPPDIVTLSPISLPAFEAASGLKRRDTKSFSSLDPSTQHSLIYGSPGSEGQTLLAEVVLTAPDGMSIILMEAFEKLSKKVDCNGKDGQLSVTFNDRSAYDYAIQKWSYINEQESSRFLLITNHDGCGPNDARQPYYVDSVDDIPEENTVYFQAAEAPWSEILGTYDLSWGEATPAQHARLRKRRDWWDDVKDALSDAFRATGDAVTKVTDTVSDAGTFDQSRAVDFRTAGGDPGVRKNIYTAPAGQLKLDCLDCWISGSFRMVGRVRVKAFQPQDVSIALSSTGFAAMLNLEATIVASTAPLSFSGQNELFSYPIPYAGIAVPNVFKLGAVLSYAVGFNTTFKGRAVVDFGLKAYVPPGAQATLVVAGPTLSSATGWETASLTPLIDLKTISASVTVAAYSKPAINFGLELNNIGKAQVQLAMNLPEVSSTLTASYSTTGVCPNDAARNVWGVNLSNQVKISLGVSANAELGPLVPPGWGRELWSRIWQLPGYCWPINFAIDVT